MSQQDNNKIPISKLCKYGCGKMVWWDDTIVAAKIKLPSSYYN